MSSPNRISADLTSIIINRIESEGAIPFRDFMEMALYYPGMGYYMSEKIKIGREGDYFTSPEVHDVFALSIMKQLAEIKNIIGSNQLHVVETGAGKGSLCTRILSSAYERNASLFESMRYTIVEKSPEMIKFQKEHLSSCDQISSVSWKPDIRSALGDGDACVVLSNELIDAFPVHRVSYDGRNWKEIYVTRHNSEFKEILEEISNPDLSEFLSGLEGPFEAGYNTEVNLDGIRWIKTVGTCLKRGFVITIDYGYSGADYYSPLRTDGTLLCYYKHSTSTDPYKRVGMQDITSHVDFTSLTDAGVKAGLEITGYCDQFHFLMGLEVFDEFADIYESGKINPEMQIKNMAIKRLLLPEGMGGTFKVLIQHKGIEAPRLKAFGFKNLTTRLHS